MLMDVLGGGPGRGEKAVKVFVDGDQGPRGGEGEKWDLDREVGRDAGENFFDGSPGRGEAGSYRAAGEGREALAVGVRVGVAEEGHFGSLFRRSFWEVPVVDKCT